jgi:hypothetical protein
VDPKTGYCNGVPLGASAGYPGGKCNYCLVSSVLLIFEQTASSSICFCFVFLSASDLSKYIESRETNILLRLDLHLLLLFAKVYPL